MTDAVEARASIIDEYVLSAEEYMTAFSLSSEVHDLLLAPDNPEILAKAQKYTEAFASVKGVFEGLYIATPNTYVLAHTSQGAIGHDHTVGGFAKNLSGHHSGPAGADQFGHYEVPRHWQHDIVHVLPHI